MTTHYGTNWDALSSFPDFVDANNAMYALKNETVYTPVRPYAKSLSFTDEQHSAMHSSRPNSDVSYPHTFMTSPIHETPNDYESKIVGHVGGGFAWDYALRYLLPDNVEGIIVEIKNSCNQTSLYELVGYDAFYLGDNATKESKYDEMEIVRNLSYSTHPNFTTTPGHCRYSIVSEIKIRRWFFVVYISKSDATKSQIHKFFPL
jgi:hypothetical protein